MFARCGVRTPHSLERQTLDFATTAGGVHQRGIRWLYRCSILPERGRVRGTAAVHNPAKASAKQRDIGGCSGMQELLQHGRQRSLGEGMGPRKLGEQLQPHNDVHGWRAPNLGKASASRSALAAAAAGPQSIALRTRTSRRTRTSSPYVDLQQVLCRCQARVTSSSSDSPDASGCAHSAPGVLPARLAFSPTLCAIQQTAS